MGSLLAAGVISNDPFKGPEDDFCQLSMPVGPEVPSALHTGNGPCADPLQSPQEKLSLNRAVT